MSAGAAPRPAREQRLSESGGSFKGENGRGSRTRSERDRDRVLYSSAFRRLAWVTQVVHAEEGVLFHNRLIHSLKVAQFGRRLAERLVRTDEVDAAAVGGIDPDVVETAGLAHDLGHPPFGHIAESELQTQLHEVAGITDGFEGNPQSFRIVTKLSVRRPDGPGLDLTRASLNAMIKYPWPKGTVGKKHQKWGYYPSEMAAFDFARHPGGASEQPCPEACLMDWADDVTYAVHDIEDFYRAGIIPLDQLLSGTAERDRIIDLLLEEPDRPWAHQFLDLIRDEYAKRLFPEILTRFTNSKTHLGSLKHFSTVLITRYMGAAALKPESEEKVAIDSESRREVNLLKSFMGPYVFNNPALVAQQHGHRMIVKGLFGILWEAAKRGSKTRSLIPLPYRDLVGDVDRQPGDDENAEKTERARLVADIIANQTERQAVDFYNRLTGAAPGSVLQPIVT